MNEGTSSSISDVNRYVINKKFQYSIFNILLLFVCRWEIHTPDISNRNVAYTKYDAE
jgi:hypothetical protein